MKRGIIMAGLLLCALLSQSCEQISIDFSRKGPEIKLSSSTPLTDGQMVGVFMTEPVSLRNVRHTASAGKLIPINPINWPVDMPDSSIWFRAYYPYTERFNTSTLVSFNTSEDQSSDEAFAEADLMLSSILLSPKMPEGVFSFEHKMAKAVIYLKNTTGKPLGSVTLKRVYSSASVNFKSGAIKPAGNITDIIFHLSSEKDGVCAYEAVLAPQNAEFNVSVMLGSDEYLLSCGTAISFLEGKEYTATRLVEFTDRTRRSLTMEIDQSDWADPDFVYEEPIPEGVEFIMTTDSGVYSLDGDYASELMLYTPIQDQYSTVSDSQNTHFRFMCPELGHLFAIKVKGTSFTQGSSVQADMVSCGIDGAQGTWTTNVSVIKSTSTQVWLQDREKNLGYVIMK